MAYDTYDQVLKLVKDWGNRLDLSDDNYFNFIHFAGNMANQLIRVPAMENTQILTVTTDGHVAIPYDLLELRSLTANFNEKKSQPLERIAWDQFINFKAQEYQPDNASYFARQGAFWFLQPAPPAGTKITCHYYRSMPDVSPTEQTNWLIQMSPMTYVYGALHFLYLFVMDDERSEYWLGKFQGELQRLQDLADKSEYKGSSLTVRARSSDYDGEI